MSAEPLPQATSKAPSPEPVDELNANHLGARTLSGPSHPPFAHPDSSTLGAALHRAQFGVIVTSESAYPSFVNSYADHVLGQRDGLSMSDSGLQALRWPDTKALRDTIGRSARREGGDSATLLLPRAHSTRPLVVHIPMPAPDDGAMREATLFICDPERKPDVDPDALCRMFGLTRSEASLATLLMGGTTIEHAAGALCISINTARTHLKRILMKTDTGRQAELLRLLYICSGQVALRPVP